MLKFNDFPKVESPFKRQLNEKGDYVITSEVTEGHEWVFNGDEKEVAATEKIHGTCCAIIIENGVVTSMFNRTNRLPFIGGTLSKALSEGLNNSLSKNRFALVDGIYWGELIGPKIQKNEYKLDEHEWLPFNWIKEHLSYKSFHNYPKTYENLKKWFLSDIKDGGLFSLYMKKRGIDMKPEGIVFHNLKTDQMSKLRLDMYDDFKGDRHKGSPQKEDHSSDSSSSSSASEE